MVQKVKPKKHLGQHFLTDQNIALRIAEALSTWPEGTILEIGPGTGVLTQHLIKLPNFKATEIDTESVVFLKNKYPNNNFILEEDVLKLDLNKFEAPIAIIGNLPYNISSQIFFKVIDNLELVSEVVCMIQKEVAERIASDPGNKTYGILSVLLQTWYNIDYLFTVHENCFNPPPKVKSGVIKLTRNNRDTLPCSNRLFKMVIKQSFNQRRKTLRNSLKNICVNLEEHTDMAGKRPEQLSVDEFIKLTTIIEKVIANTEQ